MALIGWDSIRKVRIDVYPEIVSVGAISLPIYLCPTSGINEFSMATLFAELNYSEVFTGLNPYAKKIALEVGDTGVEVPINIVAADWDQDTPFATIYPVFTGLTSASYFNLYWYVGHEDNTNVTEVGSAPSAPVDADELAAWDLAVGDTLLSFKTATQSSDIAVSGSSLTSSVVYTWLFDHNWDKGFKESLSWKTDIIASHNSTEQRIRLRAYPRRGWGYSYMLSGDIRRRFETGLGLRNVQYLIVPSSRDLDTLSTPIVMGSSTITVPNVSFTDYAEGRLMAVWTDTDTYEVQRVFSIVGDVVTFELPFEYDWPIGSTIAPCREAVCMDSRPLSRPTDDVGIYTMEFNVMGEVDFTPLALDTYDSIAICPTPINFNDVKEFVSNNWFKLDNNTGVVHYHVQSTIPYFSKEVSFLIFGLEEVYAFISFLHYCSGKLSPFWIQANDASFKINTPVGSAHNYVIINPVGYTADTLMGTSRSHIEILTTSGVTIRRAISSVEVLSSTEEKIMLTSTIGINIPLDEIAKCSWLEKVRLDTDDILIEWITSTNIKVNLQLVTIP